VLNNIRFIALEFMPPAENCAFEYLNILNNKQVYNYNLIYYILTFLRKENFSIERFFGAYGIVVSL